MPDDSKSFHGITVYSFASKCIYNNSMQKHALHDNLGYFSFWIGYEAIHG